MSAASRLETAANSICDRKFRQGDWWVWLYRDGAGNPSSWERYSVRARSGANLVIDMASKFDEAESYYTHHRMRLSIADNLAARATRKEWMFREFAFHQDDTWREAPHRDNVQAFEEKFDVFLMSAALPTAARVLRERSKSVAALGVGDLGRATLVQSRRHQYTSAWYIREPRNLAGVAAFKEFREAGNAGSPYTFELIGMGSAMDTDAAGPLSTDARGRSPYGIG